VRKIDCVPAETGTEEEREEEKREISGLCHIFKWSTSKNPKYIGTERWK